MPKLTMIQAINLALHEQMAADDGVLMMGEDVAVNGGVFRATEGLLDKFGAMRVIDTPLAEAGIVGTAIGMAIAGLKPVTEMQFSGFAFLMFHHLEGYASRLRNRTQGGFTVPMVVRMPYGGGVRALEHHSESKEAIYAQLPGLKTVIPSGPRNARALLAAAIQDPDPVVFMEPKHSYRAFREEVPEAPETMPIGKAQVVSEGEALTLVAWGAMMRPAREAAETIREERGVGVELIDLLTMNPLDGETIIESVKKTGRCVVAQEAPRTLGMSSEIVTRINDGALMYLEAPVGRVTAYDVITPGFGREQMYMPTAGRIAAAIRSTLDF